MKHNSVLGVMLTILALFAAPSVKAQGDVWTQATGAAGWTARQLHTSVVFGGKIWVIGGNNGSTYYRDVWYSSDGVNWTCATASAPWTGRCSHTSVVYDNKIWVIGGWNGGRLGDVWYSTDGVSWTRATAAAPWAARARHTSVVFSGYMWVIGGDYTWNDVWYSSNGASWTRATANAGWPGRYVHTSVVHDNKMWVIGGGATPVNDVWYSANGVNWTQATAHAQWSDRYGHTSVVFDDEMWVIGGYASSTLKDVWYSTNGSAWSCATAAAPWVARRYHTSVVFNDRMWVLGGTTNNGTSFVNDVWYSGIESPAYVVLPVSPDPNPDVSEVMQGGTFHRYYLVADTLGHPAPGQTVSAYWASTQGSFVSGDDGVVDVHFETGSHQPGEILDGAVTHVGGHAIVPVPFTAEVLARRYDRTLEFDGLIEGKVGVLVGLRPMLASAEVVRLSGTSASPDSLSVFNRASAGIAGFVGYQLGPRATVGVRSLGASIEGEVLYAGGALYDEANLGFEYPVPPEQHKDAAALYMMLEPATRVASDPALVAIAQFLSWYVQSPMVDALNKAKSGTVMCIGDLGNVSIGTMRPGRGLQGTFNGIGLTGSWRGELYRNDGFCIMRDNIYGNEVTLGGKVSAALSLDFSIVPPSHSTNEVVKGLAAQMRLWDWASPAPFMFDGSLEGMWGAYVQSGNVKKIVLRLTKSWRAPLTEDDSVVTCEFWLRSDDQQLLQALALRLKLEDLVGAPIWSALGHASDLVSTDPTTLCRSFYGALDVAVSWVPRGLTIEYRRYGASRNAVGPIEISISGGLGATHAKLGAEAGVGLSKMLLTEQGTLLPRGLYTNSAYEDDEYTEIVGDVAVVPLDLTAQVLSGVANGLFDVAKGMWPFGVESDSIVVQTGTGTLVVRSGVLQPGDSVAMVHWVWQPESTDGSLAQQIRLRLQAQAGIRYGIGGFYRVQPETTMANGHTSLRIAYADTEVVGLDESALRTYRWDDLLRKWVFAGGTASPDSNYVHLDSMELFGLYTLAPAAPSDTFGMTANPESVLAGRPDTVTVSGGPVLLNTGSVVPNGTLVTVATSVGTITTPDADTTLPGVQVTTTDGSFDIGLLGPEVAAVNTVVAQSVEGEAVGSVRVVFYDTVPPSAPESLSVRALDSMQVRVTWRRTGDADVIGYRVYYGTDSLPPYDGTSEFDVPSPVDAGADTTRVLALPLWLDSTYYICATAVDGSGWESPYSNVLAAPTGACIAGRTTYYSSADPVADVRLALAGSSADTVWSDAVGNYALAAVPWYHDYSVTPGRTESQRSPAVTSYDAALVLRHAVHQDTLDSFQFRAADVTGDTSASAMDAAYILQYAVGMIRHFPVGEMPGGDTVDWAFQPPMGLYDSIWENQTNEDYLGILYGDPSGNWPGSEMLAGFGGLEVGDAAACFGLNMPSGASTNDQAPVTSQWSNRGVRGPQPTLTGGQRAVDRGGPSEEVIFLLAARGARGVASADALVRYDSRQCTLTAIRTTQATEGFLVVAVARDGYVRIGMAGTRKLNGDVALLELVFEENSPTAKDADVGEVRSPNDEGRILGAAMGKMEVADAPGAGSVASQGRLAVGGQRLAVGGEPLADIVWLVLDEGQVQPGPTGENGVMGGEKERPATFYLAPPKPNPFGDGTRISYGLPSAGEVSLAVFDATGRKVRTLASGLQPAGKHTVAWKGRDSDGRQSANGIYFIRMKAPAFQFQRKVALLHR